MDVPQDRLSDSIISFRNRYPSPLLTLVPEDDAFMQMVYQYRADSVMRAVDKAVTKRIPDLSPIQDELAVALQKAHQLDSDITFQHFATFIGSEGYPTRVRADRQSKSLLVAIDQYVISELQCFGYFGDPMFIVHLSDTPYLTTDCMAAIAHEYIAMPPEPWSLIDYIIAEGKELYFLEQVLPQTPDSIRIRYTSDQYGWMKDNEKRVWGYLIQNDLLYDTDVMKFHNLIDEAPKTNAFGGDSAPRTTEYIGWHIVRQYMKKNNVSLKELFEETDAQKILSLSSYHP